MTIDAVNAPDTLPLTETLTDVSQIIHVGIYLLQLEMEKGVPLSTEDYENIVSSDVSKKWDILHSLGRSLSHIAGPVKTQDNQYLIDLFQRRLIESNLL